MVDAALTNMMHDVEELPSLPPLSDFATGPTYAHSHPAHAAARAALDLFDAL
jgi:hypothetical protein